jgi:beta-glucosidase
VGGLLPLSSSKLKKIAIVGGSAKAIILSGGESAALKPSYFISPYQGIVNVVSVNPDLEVTYSEGARGSFLIGALRATADKFSAYLTSPSLDYDLFTEEGKRGWTGSWHTHVDDDSMVALEKPLKTDHLDKTKIFISDSAPAALTKRWTLKLRGQMLPRSKDTPFKFGLIAAGRAKVSLIVAQVSPLTTCKKYTSTESS